MFLPAFSQNQDGIIDRVAFFPDHNVIQLACKLPVDLADGISRLIFADIVGLARIISRTAAGIAKTFHIKALSGKERKILPVFPRHHYGTAAHFCHTFHSRHTKEISAFPL